MLKTLPVFAVFIATWHIGAQVPRQGGEQQDHSTEYQTAANNLSPPFTQPTLDLRIVFDHEDNGESEHSAAQEQSHKWVEAFWPTPLSNWALVIVGGIAGFLAWLTLRKIRRQTDLMNRNNVVALASAKAALESAKTANEQIKMMKNQERARIAVTILPIKTLDLESEGENSVRMEIENLGPTHAHNVRSSATARVVVKGFDRWDVDDRDDLMLPKVIRADALPIKTYLPFIFLDEWLEEILQWRFKLIIELRGVVVYDDVFGDEHRTRFSYDLTVDKANPLLAGEVLWGVTSHFGWRATHGKDDNKAD